MSHQLQLGGLRLPLDTVTGTLVIYGGKGMGKTNLGSVLAEELAAHALRFAVLDPVGCWWGLQHGAERGQAGLEVLILGGPRGDIPILPTAGAVVADLVADEAVSVVVDCSRHANGSMWSVGEQIRFVADYTSRLYERQGERRRPLMQIIDEAGRLVPQTIPHGAVDLARCVGAIERLVELGRNVGVGVCLITQRSARMNKSVSELAEAMIAFRTVGPRSIDAIMDWFGEHVPKARWDGLIAQLRGLSRGSALVVSPGWLQFEGVVQVRARRTFDSSATPKPGTVLRAPGKATKPDLVTYQARMAATIEKAKAEDPRELQRRVRELERELAAAKKASPAPAPKVHVTTVEVPVLKDAQIRALEAAAARLEKPALRLAEIAAVLGSAVQAIRDACTRARAEPPARIAPATPAFAPSPRGDIAKWRRSAPPSSASPDADALPSAQQRILDAAAFLESLGITAPHVVQLALFAGQSANGGYWRANIGRLRTLRLMDGVRLLPAGRGRAQAAGITTVEELHAHVFDNLLEGAQKAILRVLIDAYPQALTPEECGRRVSLEPDGGYWRASVGRLRSLGLITRRGPLASLPVLFLEGAR